MSLPNVSKRFVLWALCAALWFSSLGLRELIHPDEGRYSEISREMVVTRDFVTPHLNGLKYFEKPPLQYWVTAGAFEAFGQSEFVARLWVGVCGFLTLILAWITARRLWSTESADYAAICAASMTFLIGMSHVVTLDMGVSFFLFATLCSFMLAHHENATPGEQRYWMWAAWAAMAGSLLSKGLIGFVIPGAVLVLYCLATRQWSLWKRMEWIPGLLIFSILGLPWHFMVAARNPEWAQFYLIHEHFVRFLTKEHHRPGAWYYFVPILIGGLIPWTSLLPSAMKNHWRSTNAFHPEKLLLLWVLFIFVFFSTSGSKLPGYILPVFPAIALLIGSHLSKVQTRALRPHVIGLIIFWCVVALGSFFLPHFASSRTPAETHRIFSTWLLAGAVVFASLSAIALQLLNSEHKMSAMLSLTIASLIFADLAAMGYQRSYAQLNSGRSLAKILTPRITPETHVYSVGDYDQTLPFYLKRTTTLVQHVDEFDLGEKQNPSAWIPTTKSFSDLWRKNSSEIAIISPSLYTELQSQGLPMHVLEQTSRRVVVDNLVPAGNHQS